NATSSSRLAVVAAAGAELYTRIQGREISDVASVQRQLDELALLDSAPYGRLFGAQSGCLGLHCNGLRLRAYLQLKVSANLFVNLQPDAASGLKLEAWRFNSHLVFTDVEQGQRVIAAAGGQGNALHVGADVFRSDFYARNRCACRIGDGAENRS